MPAHIVSVVDTWEFLSETGLVCNGKAVSKATVRSRVASLARGINSLAPVGAVIAVAGTNTDATFEVLLAIAAAGCIACPLNTRWSDRDVQHAVALTSPVVLFVEPGLQAIAKSAVAACPTIRIAPISTNGEQSDASFQAIPHHACLSSTSQLIAAHPAARLQLQQPECGTALICFTSGTTAAAKGVRVSHSALVIQSLTKLAVVGYARDDVYLHVAPLFHIGGISSALAVLMAGGCHVFLPTYSPAAMLAAIHQHNISAMIAVPAMLQDICSLPNPIPCPTMRRLLIGAGAASPSSIQQVAQLMPHACIQSAYGMTEAASSITFLTLVPPPHMRGDGSCSSGGGGAAGAAGSGAETAAAAPADAGPSQCVGQPAPGIQVRIRRADGAPGNGAEGSAAAASSPPEGSVEPLRVGEVLIHGPQVTSGYWRDDAATAAALGAPPGWLRTGDLGWIDVLGRLHLCGRLKDMIKSGGENVHASEVEQALASMPGVAEAAVVGVPHPRYGEAVAALLCDAPAAKGGGSGGSRGGGGSQTPAAKVLGTRGLSALSVALRVGGLAAYKVPRVAAVASEPLPRTATGKVDKRAVRAVLGAAPAGQERSRL